MKIAGSIILGLGLVIGLFLAMAPTSVTVFGDKGSCGPPLLRVIAQQDVDSANEQALIDLCEDRSVDRLVPAALIALIGTVVGGGLLVASAVRSASRPAQRPAHGGPPA